MLPFLDKPRNLDLMAYQLPNRLPLLARHIEDQCFVERLDFSLGIQDVTLEDAHERLQAQISSYAEEAIILEDGTHAKQLVRRQAPWRDWLLFL